MAQWFKYEYAVSGDREELQDLIEKIQQVELVGSDKEAVQEHRQKFLDELWQIMQKIKAGNEHAQDEGVKEMSDLDYYVEGQAVYLAKLLEYDKPKLAAGVEWDEDPSNTEHLQILSAKDGTPYFLWELDGCWGDKPLLIDVILNHYKKLRIFWNLNGQTNDYKHIYFSEEDLEKYKFHYPEEEEDEK